MIRDRNRIIQTSVTRIADFSKLETEYKPLEFNSWKHADYVLGRVIDPGTSQLELTSGRMIFVSEGDLLIGTLGVRHATLEVTGSWTEIKEDMIMHALTGAGLFGKLTSRSPFITDLVAVQYLGHVLLDGRALNMADFVPQIPVRSFATPTVLFTGTSMSSGKTASARVVTQILKGYGLKVVGAKLTGAGRYRDILGLYDSGADCIYDFVDVGLPSTAVDQGFYRERLILLLSLIQSAEADVAVVEIGASPLEPYNGAQAIAGIAEMIRCAILCAMDPYAVHGVMQSFHMTPDLVGGPATNTLAGVQLIEKLCKVQGMSLIDPSNRTAIEQLLVRKLRIQQGF